MNKNSANLNIRWLYLAVGTVTMLFAGIIYAWSILKTPFAAEFGWTTNQLALNYTFAMTFFCCGSFSGSLIVKKISVKTAVLLASVLAGAGFVLAATMQGNVVALYLFYGVMASFGIGVVYNIIIATVNSWFPDKSGLSTGCQLMGFGFSTLLFGKIMDAMFLNEAIGWRTAYIVFGVLMAVEFAAAGLIIKKPGKEIIFPAAKVSVGGSKETFETRDYTTLEMFRRGSFWKAFILITFLAAVGNAVISFAKDLAMSFGAQATFATTMVGMLSVCNGFGRIVTGAVFDAKGRRFTMLAANLVSVLAAVVTLVAILTDSLVLCVAGLCLTGFAYGANPTLCSAFPAAFYGQKTYATNYSIFTFTLMTAALVANVCSSLFVATGAYLVPFILLVVLAVVAFFLNLSIKRP